MTRYSSPSCREHQSQIVLDPVQTSGLSEQVNADMGRDKSRLDILLDSPFVVLKGVGNNVEPGLLSGHVALHLTESTAIKHITLHLRGKAHLPAFDMYEPCF
jgi:hypothetical protein